MKLPKVLTTSILIPAVLAAQNLSEDAKSLLQRPRRGFAAVVLRDGTHEHTYITRVTDSFVALGSAPSCRNVDISQISKIYWDKVPHSSQTDDDGYWTLLLILWPLIPYFLIKSGIAHLDSKRGYWESASGSDGYIEQLHVAPDEIGKGTIQYRKLTRETGHYRVDNDRLLTTTRDGDERSTQVRFQCDTLAVSGLPATLRAERITGPAAPPIVGRWRGPLETREYLPNGTFRVETLAKQLGGSYQKNKDGTTVFAAGQTSLWKIRKSRGSLLVTRDGNTVEFKRRKPF